MLNDCKHWDFTFVVGHMLDYGL